MSNEGWIYYIACLSTMRCKIGFTTGNPVKRLKAMQTGAPAPLVLMAVHRGSMAREKELHEQFAEYHVHGEWFEASEEMLRHVSMITWLAAKECIALGTKAPGWVVSGLQSMHEDIAPLPDDLKELAGIE